MCSNEDDAHPCGLYKTVHVVEFFTCAQTLINIVNVSAYNTSTHVVPCLADVCVEKSHMCVLRIADSNPLSLLTLFEP